MALSKPCAPQPVVFTLGFSPRQEPCFGLLDQMWFWWRLKAEIPQAICARG